ncbi:unnamed protein product [Lathyrus oleraceus]|uniref:RING-type E3 ubiquitin transferase n=1 Tax=Pisum sativum TaxID=3888 RepID=A0A9D4YEF6_PEA|nr:RING-H2 finger protein ATL46-like isoform X2 [Pisum sativum]KAI5436999.1 hypothetical protein KIW84_023210 [Pisum sativum]
MHLFHSQIHDNNGAIVNPPILSPYSSPIPYNSNSNSQKQSEPAPISSSGNKISPAILFIIVILAIIFFILGFLHLLVRFLIKHRSSSSSSISQSNRFPEMSESDAYQRQLQQLFNLHDSDTWLLSNSTCPLCRGTLYAQGFSFEKNPVFEFEDQRDEDCVIGIGSVNKNMENHIMNGKRVFSVRLGKFRSSNNAEGVGKSQGESSNCSFDVRRCYSMGSFQYVVCDSELQVALRPSKGDGSMRQLKGIREIQDESFSNDGDVEGKKINIARKGESFSVSKIWQWSKKDNKIPSSSDTHFHNCVVNESLPWMNKS